MMTGWGEEEKERIPLSYNEELRQGGSVGSEVKPKVHSKAPRDRSRIEPNVRVAASMALSTSLFQRCSKEKYFISNAEISSADMSVIILHKVKVSEAASRPNTVPQFKIRRQKDKYCENHPVV